MASEPKPYILIVDDTEANVRVLGPLLRAEGWSVAAAKNGAQALDLIARRAPDLLLLDVMMPEMDGFEVCRRLRADPATRELPVLFITALTDEESILRGFGEGGQDYIAKPLRPPELIARARTHLALRAARLRAERQAADLLRLNADKDRFFSIIAHDLRSPLAGLLGLSETLASHPEEFSAAEVAESAAAMAKSARNLFQLLENLLEWAQLETGRMECNLETFDLAPVLEELGSLFAPTAQQKGVTLRYDLQATPVWADRRMTLAVFRNLLSNALKFTPAGGIIEMGSFPAAGRAVGKVRDTGAGLTAEELEKLFAPGAKATSRAGTAGERGTGLGLVLCREFLQRNRGVLTAASVIGRGSTFTVTLPCDAASPG